VRPGGKGFFSSVAIRGTVKADVPIDRPGEGNVSVPARDAPTYCEGRRLSRAEQPAATADHAPAAPHIQWMSWRSLLVFASTAALLFLLIRGFIGTDRFLHALQRARWEYGLLPVALTAVNLVIAVIRWKIVLRAMGYHLPFGSGLGACLSTTPLQVLVPSRAGDLMRAIAVRDVAPPMAGAGSILADRLIDIQSLCIFAIVGAASHGRWLWCAIVTGVLLCEWACLLLLVHFRSRLLEVSILKRIRSKLRLLLSAFEALRTRPAHFVLLSFTALGTWAVVIAAAYACLRMTGANLHWSTVGSLWPIATFAAILPITTAGLGTRDAAFAYLVASTSSSTVDPAPIVLATIIYSLTTNWIWAVIGLPWTIRLLSTAMRAQSPLRSSETA
jgi:glycosyltransferase 2 family protein